MRHVLALLVCLIAAPVTAAESIGQMVCKDSAGLYQAIYRDGHFWVGSAARATDPYAPDIEYEVVTVDDTPEHFIVAGIVGNGSSVAFIAKFRPERGIQFFDDLNAPPIAAVHCD